MTTHMSHAETADWWITNRVGMKHGDPLDVSSEQVHIGMLALIVKELRVISDELNLLTKPIKEQAEHEKSKKDRHKKRIYEITLRDYSGKSASAWRLQCGLRQRAAAWMKVMTEPNRTRSLAFNDIRTTLLMLKSDDNNTRLAELRGLFGIGASWSERIDREILAPNLLKPDGWSKVRLRGCSLNKRPGA